MWAEIFKFLLEILSPTGALILIICIGMVYMWYQHHHVKLLKERNSSFEEEVKKLKIENHNLETLISGLKQNNSYKESEDTIFSKGRYTDKYILVVEYDKYKLRKLLTAFLRKKFNGASVASVLDGEEAIAEIARREPSLLILDMDISMHTPNISGVDVLKKVGEANSKFPIVVISAFECDRYELAKQSGIEPRRIRYFQKPFSFEDMENEIADYFSKTA